MRKPIVQFIGGALTVGVLVTGCQATASAPEPTAWEEPAWMAEQAEMREQFTVDVQACMDAKGWELTVDSYGGFAERFDTREELNRASADRNDCVEEAGYSVDFFDDELSREALSTLYDKHTDTYECLLHEGVEMEETPPAKEAWIENMLQGQESWIPHLDAAVVLAGEQRAAELKELCPAPWPFALQ